MPLSARAQTRKNFEQGVEMNMASMESLRREAVTIAQKRKDCKSRLESILEQLVSLGRTLDTDEQLQLFKDFVAYYLDAKDQTKVHEFIVKMRGVLPADKMQTFEDLYRQVRENNSERDRLDKEGAALRSRFEELSRQQDEMFRYRQRELELQRTR